MSDYKIRLGKYGENLAADFLIKRGYKIIDRNYQTVYGELDLIATNSDELLFVEVKTRTKSSYGFPELAVNREKVKHLMKAARVYLTYRKLTVVWQLDIISVEIDPLAKTAKIRRFQDIRLDY